MPSHMENTVKEVDNYAIVASFYDYLMRHVNYRRWYRFVADVLKRNHVPDTTLLEFACGTGNMLLYFAKAGWSVVGVDKSQAMLDVARWKLSEYQSSAQLYNGDMREERIYGEFAAVICLYDSINYCLDEQELQRTVLNMLNNLISGGVLIFDICTVNNCSNNFRNYTEKEFFGNKDYTRKAFFDVTTNQQVNEFWITSIPQNEIVFHEMHVQQIYRIDRVKEMIEEIGSCRIDGIFENYTRRPGLEKSDRVHFVITKL
ncbi:MAG: class I SAM-dependent methyltransferase [Deferribacteres bacterium]|nr:class I SAM-dependent methyltransferase [Deferribacteres bacterium]